MNNFSELRDFYTELVTQMYFYDTEPTSHRLVRAFNPVAVTYEDYKNTLLSKGVSGHAICWPMVLAESTKDIDSQLLWTEKDFRQAQQVQTYLEGTV
jgi:hypothetical protein